AALRALQDGLLVVAETDDDLSFVHSSWTQGIEAWRFQLPGPSWWAGPFVAHTVLDRSLFRAGDTVHMKHLFRAQTIDGFAEVPADERPKEVFIRHRGSGEHYTLPLDWDASGAAVTEWAIPKAAKLGR